MNLKNVIGIIFVLLFVACGPPPPRPPREQPRTVEQPEQNSAATDAEPIAVSTHTGHNELAEETEPLQADTHTEHDPIVEDADSTQINIDASMETAIRNAGWGDNVTISIASDSFTFVSNGLPDHASLDSYMALSRNGSNVVNLTATQQNYQIPLNPVYSEQATPVTGGAIGVALSGGVFYSPFEGGHDSAVYANEDNFVVDTIPFIDGCGGHPNERGIQYHYHGVPYCISDALDRDGQHSYMVGVMLDGFPVYGPQDSDGEAPTHLDECSGHVGATPEFPDGIYHYHTLETRPYSIKCYHGEVTIPRR